MESTALFYILSSLAPKLAKQYGATVKVWITTFDPNSTGKFSAKIELYKYLVQHPKATLTSAIQHIQYVTKKAKDKEPADSERNFYMVQKRLYEKLIEFLVLGTHLKKGSKEARWSAYTEARISTKKAICEIILAKTYGEDGLAFRLIDEVVETARKYELYSELQEALRFSLGRHNIQTNRVGFEQTTLALADCMLCLTAESEAEGLYLAYYTRIGHSGLNKDDLAYLIQHIDRLRTLSEKHDSARIGFYVGSLEAELWAAFEEYGQALQGYKHVLQLVQQSPGLNFPIKTGDALLNVALQHFNLYQFEQALECVEQAIPFYSQGHSHLYLGYELRGLALTYVNQPHEAIESIVMAKHGVNEEVHELAKARRSLILANLYFICGEFKNAGKALLGTRVLEKDRGGWNIGVRVLFILLRIERKDFDGADDQIEALRKHIERLGVQHELRERDSAVCRILISLSNQSYNYTAVRKKQVHLFEVLERPEKGYRWEPQTHEIIVFNRWFEAKRLKTKYSFEIPQSIPLPKSTTLPELLSQNRDI